MGRAFRRASPAVLPLEDFTRKNQFHHTASDRDYQLIRRGDRFFQRRSQKGYQGAETNVVELEIHYVLGSGNHARSYLHRTAENRLIEMPVGWYAENGGQWAMSPGFDRWNHAGFRRAVGYSCMFCHNGYPNVAPGSDSVDADPVYPADLPSGIDCQRCHGPGQAHASAALSRQPAARIKEAIFNPKHAPRERQAELCMQCHLESTSFPLPYSVQRFDRGVFSFRPGEPLVNYAFFFDHAPGAGQDEKFEIVNSVYRLRQSECFRKSNGALLCTTCHDPHKARRGEAAREHYAAVCRTCHEKAHAPAPDCASCHMPKRRTEDVVHAVMTDHKIQRRAPRNPLAPRAELTSGRPAYRGEVVLYYPSGLPPPADGDLYVAVAQVGQGSNMERGIPQLEAAISRHQPSNAQFYFELAQAQFKSGKREAALENYRQALRRKPNFPAALRSLGSAQLDAGDVSGAIATLEQGRAANDAKTHHALARAYQRAGRLSGARAEAASALRFDPDLVEAHVTLGGVCAQLGDAPCAEAALREAIRRQPDFPEAHSDLANLLTAAGDARQAEYHFQQALKFAPHQANIRYNFGVLLAMTKRFADAERQLVLALADAPNLAEAHESLGNLCGRRGDWRGAATHYQKALAAKPGFDRAQLGLGTALAALGDVSGARTYLTQAAASQEPAVRAEAAEILKAIEEAPARR